MNQHEFTFHNLPRMESFHFTYTAPDDRLLHRLDDISRQLARLNDSAGDKEKLRALEKELDAKKAEWTEAIEPAAPAKPE